jgi:hypothetical protein
MGAFRAVSMSSRGFLTTGSRRSPPVFLGFGAFVFVSVSGSDLAVEKHRVEYRFIRWALDTKLIREKAAACLVTRDANIRDDITSSLMVDSILGVLLFLWCDVRMMCVIL